MKILLTILVCFISLKNSTLSEIRQAYSQVNNSTEKQQEFVTLLQKTTDDTPVIRAYRAAATIIASKSLKGKQRTDLFKEGTSMLEKIVKEQSDDLEIRLIRLSVQEHLPKFLNYNKNINDDAQFIKDNLSKIKDKELLNYVNSYITQSKQFQK